MQGNLSFKRAAPEPEFLDDRHCAGGFNLASLLFGIGVFPPEAKLSALKVVEAVREAEEAGFDRAWIADSQGLFRDLYVTLTLCGTRTGRIQLGAAVTNPITRHPAVTARAISTLDEIWPGRILLGVGAGDTSMKHLGVDPLRPQ
ncbi:MAG: LLM class flavin-dependent oxidoreductase, partial [Nitrospinota bacterium]